MSLVRQLFQGSQQEGEVIQSRKDRCPWLQAWSWGQGEARRGLQNSNRDIRKGEGDPDPGITRLLKGSSEVRGPSGISVPVGGTT